MAGMLTREQILARKTGRGTVTLSDGGKVAIRALTRDETLVVREMESLADRDNFIIATGMTEPQLSVEDVAAWAASDNAGDLATVSEAIGVISGMAPTSGKESTKSPSRRR